MNYNYQIFHSNPLVWKFWVNVLSPLLNEISNMNVSILQKTLVYKMWRIYLEGSDCEELVEAITEVVRVGLTEWQVYWWRWRDSNQPHQIVCNYIIIKFNFLK